MKVLVIGGAGYLGSHVVRKLLENNHHVIIDKPAFTNYSDATRLVKIANKRKKLLAEATVYSFHPQIDLIKMQCITSSSELWEKLLV